MTFKKWEPLDWVILIITVTVSVAVIAALASEFGTDDPKGEIKQVVMALIAILSLWIGSKVKLGNDDDTKPDD